MRVVQRRRAPGLARRERFLGKPEVGDAIGWTYDDFGTDHSINGADNCGFEITKGPSLEACARKLSRTGGMAKAGLTLKQLMWAIYVVREWQSNGPFKPLSEEVWIKRHWRGGSNEHKGSSIPGRLPG